jgi:hypothetical protein
MKLTGHCKKYSKKYHRAHYYLRTKHGKANKCESKKCSGVSKKYEWALKKGKEYSFNKNDYLQLCKSCHSKYDYKGGIVISEGHKQKLREVMTGTIPPNKGNDSRVNKTCKYCKKNYLEYKSKRKTYCSINCRNLDMINKPTRNKYGRKGKNDS